jgi:hypothetical protein
MVFNFNSFFVALGHKIYFLTITYTRLIGTFLKNVFRIRKKTFYLQSIKLYIFFLKKSVFSNFFKFLKT